MLRRVAPGGWGEKAERYAMFCAGWEQPSGLLVRAPESKRKPMTWITETSWATDIAEAGECEKAAPESRIEGFEAVTRRCTARTGLRRLMLAAQRDGDAYLLDFLPNNAPLAERALMAVAGRAALDAPAGGNRATALNALQEMVGGAGLVSVKEIAEFDRLRDLADGLNEARQYRKAELAFQSVLSGQERFAGPNNPALARTLQQMADPVRNQRRIDDAEALIARAAPLAAKTTDPLTTAYQLAGMAYNAGARGDTEASLRYSEQMLKFMEQQGTRFRGTSADANWIYANRVYRQNPAAGEAPARRAYQLRAESQGSTGTWTNRARILLAKTLVAQKKLAEAKPLVDEALVTAELTFGRTIWWANAKIVEAEYHLAAGNESAALESFRAYAAVSAREPYACYYAPCAGPYVELLLGKAEREPAAAQTYLAEAFAVLQLSTSPVVDTAITQLSSRVAADDPGISEVTRAQQNLGERQTRLRANLAAELRKPVDKRDAAKEAELTEGLRSLAGEIEARELRLQDGFPRYAQLASRKPVAVAQAMAALKADEALVYYVNLGPGGYSLLLQGGQISVHRVTEPGSAITRRVVALRAGVNAESGAIPTFDAVAAHDLYQTLFSALLAKTTAKRLIFVPGGAMLSLPPDVLVAEPPVAGQPVQWLIRRHALSVVPSVQSLVNLRAAPKALPPKPLFLGVGDPAFGAAGASAPAAQSGPCSARRNVRAEVAGLAPLPETAGELRGVAATLGQGGVELLLGTGATKAALKRVALDKKDVIDFATHGLLPEDLCCEDEPSLALTPGTGGADDDGLLRASDVIGLRLNASMVILSACNTAGADGRLSGESLSGLVRAFFFAGARNVFATHWPIASEPTVALTTGMAQRAAGANGNWPEALRQAKLAMMDKPETAHPIFWGAFSLIGGG